MSQENDRKLITKLLQALSASITPDLLQTHHKDTFAEFCRWCKQATSNQSQILHELINNKLFIYLIIKHFRTFNTQIIQAKQSAKKPLDYVFSTFFEILSSNIKIADTEQHIENCFVILITLSETQYFHKNIAQVRCAFSRENNNLFSLFSSILSHCTLYRLYLSNYLFRFLQLMLPPINTSKSKSFCSQFDITHLLDRCCTFMIYRVHIDGDGYVDKNKDNYNNLYGIETPLPPYIDSVISIITYFICSKSHKHFVLEHEQITPCITTLCIRLCHELQNIFELKPFRELHNKVGTHQFANTPSVQTELTKALQAMANSFNNGEYIGHNLVIEVSMEYLYYYALESDIKSVRIPSNSGINGTESFDDCWIDYQYVIALLRLVTQNKILGLYLDTIAKQLGYNVNVESDVERKKQKELTCHQIYSMNKMSCFYSRCNKSLNMKDKNKLKKCRRCQSAFYCNKKCQKNDWKYHKQICNQDNDETKNTDNDIVCENTDCLNEDNLRRCTGCYGVFYCSVKCQTEHWKQHKTQCKQKRKERQYL